MTRVIYLGSSDHSTCTGGDCPRRSDCIRNRGQLELFHPHLNAPWNPDTGRCDHFIQVIKSDLPPLPEVGCCAN